MTIKNVNADKLLADKALKAQMEDRIRDGVLDEFEGKLEKGDVLVNLRKGSIVADVDIKVAKATPVADFKSISKQIESSSGTLSTKVISNIKTVEGLDQVTTGNISVDESSIQVQESSITVRLGGTTNGGSVVAKDQQALADLETSDAIALSIASLPFSFLLLAYRM